MSYLLVVAHPDDEVLGAGATIHKLASQGEDVHVAILSYNAEARAFRPDAEDLHADAEEAMKELGVKTIYKGAFPNIRLNTVAHLELVQFIEKAIIDCKADHIITHHPNDLNNDHLHTSLACQAAVRLFQRRDDVVPVKALWFMEVLSSTEWATNKGMNAFDPTVFVEVGREGLEKKLEALAAYRGVMRPYPHPRSREALEGLAAYRGAQSGVCYAEAFQVAMQRVL